MSNQQSDDKSENLITLSSSSEEDQNFSGFPPLAFSTPQHSTLESELELLHQQQPPSNLASGIFEDDNSFYIEGQAVPSRLASASVDSFDCLSSYNPPSKYFKLTEPIGTVDFDLEHLLSSDSESEHTFKYYNKSVDGSGYYSSQYYPPESDSEESDGESINEEDEYFYDEENDLAFLELPYILEIMANGGHGENDVHADENDQQQPQQPQQQQHEGGGDVP